jgi:hypothetical protein
LSNVAILGTGRLPPALVRVGLINEAQLEHELGSLGEMDTYPIEDWADHTLAAQGAAADPIYSLSSESDSEYGREVYMVEQGGELPKKTTEELQWEVEEEIARAQQLARELNKRKGNNGLQDDLGGSEDEHPDGAPTRSHHPKFNSWLNTNQDRLWHRSRSIHEEFGRVEY